MKVNELELKTLLKSNYQVIGGGVEENDFLYQLLGALNYTLESLSAYVTNKCDFVLEQIYCGLGALEFYRIIELDEENAFDFSCFDFVDKTISVLREIKKKIELQISEKFGLTIDAGELFSFDVYNTIPVE